MSCAFASASGPVGPFSLQTTHRIESRVHRLVRVFCLQADDASDLTQSLYLRLLTACRNAGIVGSVPDEFATAVIRMWYLDAGRKVSRRKKRERRTAQLSAMPSESAELCDSAESAGRSYRSARHELHLAVSKLAPKEQELAHRVARGSAAQVARERGVSRGTVTRQVQRLGKGLKDFDNRVRN
ncbi:MAG: sigma-70 family RNA polymerase sigma factor [Phycisphaerales bacterium]|nr:sigma-70 family RNA polymerase sigma factor [Phycisphaerales bacterium]